MVENNFNIEQFLDLSNYATEERVARRKGSKSTQEFFTPYDIVKKMCDKISDEDWSDPDKTFLEPCFGNGQFVCYILWNRLRHGVHWKTALETLYGVELMQDNVEETKQRVHELLKNISSEYDPKTADEIMNRNFVCSDFFKWDFENWCPLKEEKKKKIDKNKIKEIDKRIERHQKEYISKMRDAMLKAKDFKMTN